MQFRPVNAAVKWARGRNAVDKLCYEAGIYQRELFDLQGKVVPMTYGCYTAFVEGVDVGCLVLEWCGGTVNYSKDELTRRRILAACRVHAAGILHGRLQDRHFVMSMDHTVRIVDFSEARSHKCRGAIPLLDTEEPGDIPAGCEELEDLEARSQDWSPWRRLLGRPA
ncbi:hypothetical protein BDW22DRAFT_1349679 [Trametopsis cervina]|nr:hypothetical protein BDW22DRAFT_1349679 [Trametopsis cervina]